jgi:hypothetical protein
MSTIFDCRCSEKVGGLFPEIDVPTQGAEHLIDPKHLRVQPLRLPDVSEPLQPLVSVIPLQLLA